MLRFLVILMLGLSCYVFVFLPGGEQTQQKPQPRPLAANLSPEELKQVRGEYLRLVQPEITRLQKDLEKLLQQYQKIIRDAERTGDMFATYYNLGVIERTSMNYQAVVQLPDSMPDDVKKLIEEAMDDYNQAAFAIRQACREIRNLIDEGKFRSAEKALDYTKLAVGSKSSGDLKIVSAKLLLGFR